MTSSKLTPLLVLLFVVIGTTLVLMVYDGSYIDLPWLQPEMLLDDEAEQQGLVTDSEQLASTEQQQQQQQQQPQQEQRRPRETCVIFHMGTPSEWHVYPPYLRNVKEPYDLYVTVPMQEGAYDFIPHDVDASRAGEIVRWLREIIERDVPFDSNDREIVILPMENRGLDPGGFLVAMGTIMKMNRTYEYLLKVHTKTARHGDGWRHQLLIPILGSEQQILNCLITLRSMPTVGMVGAARWLVTEGMRPDVTNFAVRQNLPHISEGTRQFIGGTMFWARFKLFLWPFRDGVDPIAVYTALQPGYVNEGDGHRLERLIGDWVLLQGYQIVGTS